MPRPKNKKVPTRKQPKAVSVLGPELTKKFLEVLRRITPSRREELEGELWALFRLAEKRDQVPGQSVANMVLSGLLKMTPSERRKLEREYGVIFRRAAIRRVGLKP